MLREIDRETDAVSRSLGHAFVGTPPLDMR